MKKRKGDDWFPFWIDKWIFGSTRDELTVEQCAVWVDFLALSYKDDGYIRANEGIPYPIKRLAGLLNRSEELIQQTIDRCLEKEANKLRLDPDGTLYVISHPEYELSGRHKRRLSEDDVRKNGHDVQKSDTKIRLEKRRIEKERRDKIKKEKAEKLLEVEFEEFWKFYYQMGNKEDDPGDKQVAKKAYKTLRRKESKGNVVKATNGYGEFLKHKELKEGFKQRKLYASTFLRSKRWERFLTFKYTPSL